MQSPFENSLHQRLEAVCVGVTADLHRLDRMPQEIGRSVVRILVGAACQSQHVGNIQAARTALAKIPALWLQQVIPSVIPDAINTEDEWEFRRLLEVLRDTVPSQLPAFVQRGLVSMNLEVREAAEDFAGFVSPPGITSPLGQVSMQEPKK